MYTSAQRWPRITSVSEPFTVMLLPRPLGEPVDSLLPPQAAKKKATPNAKTHTKATEANFFLLTIPPDESRPRG
jgi:hypothetical protein